jgi:prophage regulatory protein
MTEFATLDRPIGRLLKMKDVVAETSLHRATIYRRIAEGDFPRPVPIGGGRVAWPEREIEAWKQRQLEQAN